MRVYKSKLDIAILLALILSFSTSFIIIASAPSWFGLVPLSIALLLTIYLFATTDYTIKDDILQIRCGFLLNKKIKVDGIQRIAKTHSIYSAPALSLSGRIKIEYEEGKSIVISPKEKEAFLSELLLINNHIEVLA